MSIKNKRSNTLMNSPTEDQDIQNSNNNPQNQLPNGIIQQLVQVRSQFLPPEMLKAYNEIQPDLVNRIFSIQENEQKHRHNVDMENIKLHKKNLSIRTWGQIFSFFLAAAIIVGSILLLLNNKTIEGSIFSVAGLAGIFGLYYKIAKLKSKNE